MWWKVVEGCGRLWKVKEPGGMYQKPIEGHGTPRKYMEGHGRISQPEHSRRISKQVQLTQLHGLLV